MEYPKEFENLIKFVKSNCKGEYIGVGNPISNVLFVGKEPAIPEEKKLQRLCEIEENCTQWENNINQGLDIIDIYCQCIARIISIIHYIHIRGKSIPFTQKKAKREKVVLLKHGINIRNYGI